jgi:hypothetical protein
MELYSWENGKKSAKQRYLYRAPGDIRIEQIGLFRTGVVVVIRSDGRVRVRGGGSLSFIEVNLSKDSKWLRGITGDSALESDWVSIFRKAKKMAPFVVKSECRPTLIGFQRGYEVIIHLKNQPFDRVRFIIRGDGPILLVDRFKGEKLRTRVQWKDIEINLKVVDEDFEI